jgi:hypothetical protein
MSDELDLTNPPASEEPRRRRRRPTPAEESAREARDESKVEGEIRSRLERTFDRIVKARRARDDEELAEVVEEDAEAMTQGFLSLTHNVPFLRLPLLMLLNILEPVLAFNRVARILAIRLLTRRQRRQEARAQAQADYEAQVAAENSGVVA